MSLDLTCEVSKFLSSCKFDAVLFCDGCRWSSTDIGWTRFRVPEDKEKLLERVKTVGRKILPQEQLVPDSQTILDQHEDDRALGCR